MIVQNPIRDLTCYESIRYRASDGEESIVLDEIEGKIIFIAKMANKDPHGYLSRAHKWQGKLNGIVNTSSLANESKENYKRWIEENIDAMIDLTHRRLLKEATSKRS